MSPAQTSVPGSQPVWPTSAKVVGALLIGALISAVALVQWVPDDLEVSNTGAVNPGNQAFVPVDPGTGSTNDDSSSSGSSVGTSGGGGVVTSGGTATDDTITETDATDATNTAGSAAGSAGGVGGGLTGGGDGGSAGGTDPTQGGKLKCAAGQNGGETDTGVSDSKIRLAANVVLTGPGANFLDQSPDGMNAVKVRVNNKEGGICGRSLDLNLVNDEWDAARGLENIRNFIEEGYFGLPVVPSSEGLSEAIKADGGLIQKEGIPVYGTDGMRKEQYDAEGKAGWVAPVATATVSQVRIMAKYAHDELGARKFGIVYDKVYKFGIEGADAYEDYIDSKLGDSELASRMAIEPLKPKYQTEANQFLEDCGDCDLVVLLLEPETGKTWMSAMGNPEGMTVMGAQPLFNDKFASGCGSVCNGVFVWTGYNPAIGANVNEPDIAEFINEVQNVNPSADVTNQFLMGAYMGMEMFVETLKACSPDLTRDCVQSELHSMTYSTDMSSALKWTPNDHFANKGARAYSITYDGQKFSGFKDEQTGFINDPTPGVVPD